MQILQDYILPVRRFHQLLPRGRGQRFKKLIPNLARDLSYWYPDWPESWPTDPQVDQRLEQLISKLTSNLSKWFPNWPTDPSIDQSCHFLRLLCIGGLGVSASVSSVLKITLSNLGNLSHHCRTSEKWEESGHRKLIWWWHHQAPFTHRS